MKQNRQRSLVFFLVFWGVAAQSASIRDLTQTPSVSDIKISPDGKYLAILLFDQDKHVLRFLDRESLEVVGGMAFPGAYEPGDIRWANDERVVGEVLDLDTGPQQVSYGELFGVNFDGSGAKLIFGARAGEMRTGSNIPNRTADRAWGDIIDVVPNDDRHILISATSYSETRDEGLWRCFSTRIRGSNSRKSRFPSMVRGPSMPIALERFDS